MFISIITPAHNEEKYLGKCLSSVKKAAQSASVKYEHIVVINRCTDQTESIARSLGCRIVHENSKNLSCIRNAGVAHACGDIIVTIDADSWISENMFTEVIRMLNSGQYIGGGVRIYPERLSAGIFCSLLIVMPFVLLHGVSVGMLWCFKSDFDAVGGFNESLICVEDIDLARRLKKLGKNTSKHYGTIRKAHMITSCRKFDQFGDWYFVRNPKLVYDIFTCKQDAANEFYYDISRI
jgi:hypothetical protein